MVAVFAVFDSGPDVPSAEAGNGRVAGMVAASGEAPFLDFPIVPDTKLVSIPVSRNAHKAPELSAKALLVRDVRSGVTMLEKNSSSRLPIASLTKLMTALVVMEKSSLDEEVEIKNSDLAVPAYRIDFSPREILTVRDLLTAMLVSSANDAALSLARHTMGSTANFVKAMNDKAGDLRMASTSFSNPVGFDDQEHYSTASDLSRLVEEFMNHGDLMDIVKMKSAVVSSVSGKQKIKLYSTNKLLLDRPEVIGLKTGYTAEAGGSLIILVNIGSESAPLAQYYSIMLGSDDREKETALIIKWIEDNFLWK